MQMIARAVGLALILLSVLSAQDAVFERSACMGASGVKTTPVQLVVSNTSVTIRSKDNPSSVILELPYSSINNLGYTFVEHGKASLLPVLGITAFFIKGQSHWLVMESSAEPGS